MLEYISSKWSQCCNHEEAYKLANATTGEELCLAIDQGLHDPVPELRKRSETVKEIESGGATYGNTDGIDASFHKLIDMILSEPRCPETALSAHVVITPS